MRFICKKCSQILTNDLYPTKKLNIPESLPNSMYTQQEESVIFKGSYYFHNRQLKHHKYAKENYRLNPSDIIDQHQLKFVYGNGCCGNSYAPFYCPYCSENIGNQYLDCYEDKFVSFFDNKITFLYNKISYDFVLKNNKYDIYWNSQKGWVDILEADLFSKYHISKKLFDIEGIFLLKEKINLTNNTK